MIALGIEFRTPALRHSDITVINGGQGCGFAMRRAGGRVPDGPLARARVDNI